MNGTTILNSLLTIWVCFCAILTTAMTIALSFANDRWEAAMFMSSVSIVLWWLALKLSGIDLPGLIKKAIGKRNKTQAKKEVAGTKDDKL